MQKQKKSVCNSSFPEKNVTPEKNVSFQATVLSPLNLAFVNMKWSFEERCFSRFVVWWDLTDYDWLTNCSFPAVSYPFYNAGL